MLKLGQLSAIHHRLPKGKKSRLITCCSYYHPSYSNYSMYSLAESLKLYQSMMSTGFIVLLKNSLHSVVAKLFSYPVAQKIGHDILSQAWGFHGALYKIYFYHLVLMLDHGSNVPCRACTHNPLKSMLLGNIYQCGRRKKTISYSPEGCDSCFVIFLRRKHDGICLYWH